MNILTFLNNAKKNLKFKNHRQFTYPLTHLHAKNTIKINTHLREKKANVLILTYNPNHTQILHYLGGF
jgi:hypothetical protein